MEAKAAKTVIAEDVEIVGSIKCSSDIQIDGKLNGDLSSAGNAEIGPSASIKGNLTVNSAIVLGQVHGNIVAKDRIDLKASAHLSGDLRGKRLTVEEGVAFVGKSEVNPSGASRSAARTDVPPIATGEPDAAAITSMKEEIRKDVVEEVKTKGSSRSKS